MKENKKDNSNENIKWFIEVFIITFILSLFFSYIYSLEIVGKCYPHTILGCDFPQITAYIVGGLSFPELCYPYQMVFNIICAMGQFPVISHIFHLKFSISF